MLALPAFAAAAPRPAVLTFKTAKVGAPGNPSVGVVPFTDAVYRSCAEAPETPEKPCQQVGSVGYRFGIGKLEVTVAQYVAFLNTVDPAGRNRHRLYSRDESSSDWPRFGQIDFRARARKGRHYRVGFPEWADKPYGFANFLRSARFANSLTNGRLLSRRPSSENGFRYVTYRVRLSRRTGSGMYDMRNPKTTRTAKRGFTIPSQDEWIKAAYFDPSGPTAPGPEACATVNPFGFDPTTYAKLYAGSLGTVGQALTLGPWGTLDQGGNAVEWTDTITPPPFGIRGARVWRRLHGGIANAPVYRLWLSAVGLQPQDNAFYTATYPWLGIRIGAIGNPKPSKR